MSSIIAAPKFHRSDKPKEYPWSNNEGKVWRGTPSSRNLTSRNELAITLTSVADKITQRRGVDELCGFKQQTVKNTTSK